MVQEEGSGVLEGTGFIAREEGDDFFADPIVIKETANNHAAHCTGKRRGYHMHCAQTAVVER